MPPVSSSKADQPAYPDQVNADNWATLQAQGFRFLTNTGWPISLEPRSTESPFNGSSTQAVIAKHGHANVLFGHVLLPGKTAPSLADTQRLNMVGIYVKDS